ncbi:MAG: linearmycin/streptolysin transport system permease protein [Candidatus Binatota bacterium]|nr:linearmycin/streptolysin transport system permease protein [Candidatus Binatota bacterium]
MVQGLIAAFRKDLLLLLRDRPALIFLTIAPIVVITVAGFSLASLYGSSAQGSTPPVLLLVDEDRGRLAELARERLEKGDEVRIQIVADRGEAASRIRDDDVGAALIFPAGTTAAVAAGRPGQVLLYTDPAKYLQIANVRTLVQELRHELEVASRKKAGEHLAEARDQALAAHAGFESATREFRQKAEEFRAALAAMREEIVDRMTEARKRAADELDEDIASAATKRSTRVRERLTRELAPLKAFLADLSATKRQLEEWQRQVEERVGPVAKALPPPPRLPVLPPSIQSLAAADPEELANRVLGASIKFQTLGRLPRVAVPRVPDFPRLDLPKIPQPPEAKFPGTVEVEETSVTGAPKRLNTFDQNVPGFSVTFLLLGILLGVSLGLLDERDWGTLDRLRTLPMPFTAAIVAKLGSRFVVGMLQMALLFAVGWIAFGVSLGPQPWALALPTAGIVFAGTAFGLVVAAIARTRDSVLPVGSIVIVTMAAIGGCWWPIDLEPDWMRRVALAFPTTWAMSAYNDLMIRRQTVEAALMPTAVLFAYGALYLAVGLVLFRRHLRST